MLQYIAPYLSYLSHIGGLSMDSLSYAHFFYSSVWCVVFMRVLCSPRTDIPHLKFFKSSGKKIKDHKCIDKSGIGHGLIPKIG